MSKGARVGAAVLVGFVVYRVGVEILAVYVSLAVGLAAAGATWLLTESRGRDRTE